MTDQSNPAFDLEARFNRVREILPAPLQHASVLQLLELSLAEDLHPEGLDQIQGNLKNYDITSAATLPQNLTLKALVFTRKPGVLAGLPLVAAVFTLLDPEIDIEYHAADGDRVKEGQTLALFEGDARALLAGERTAMNFLGRLSGIATLTGQFVEAVAYTKAIILDTRKTAPGYRILDKYAVRMGGGQNHRMGLYDMVLIKNNHVDAAGGIEAAVNMVSAKYGDRYPIEVEVRTLDEFADALAMNPTRILLDNMDMEIMRQAVELGGGKVPLEASGNVTINTVAEIAETGVGYISAGSLTHSAPVLDVSMHIEVPSDLE